MNIKVRSIRTKDCFLKGQIQMNEQILAYKENHMKSTLTISYKDASFSTLSAIWKQDTQDLPLKGVRISDFKKHNFLTFVNNLQQSYIFLI